MYFSSVDRSCVKLFLFSTVLLNVTFLKIGLIVVQWENENSLSVVNEKKVVGAVELKEGTTVDIFLKLMLYNEIDLSLRFQDYFSHVWEHSRFIIQTVIKQTLLHKKALLGKKQNNMFSPF